jgi:hypothetical protein
MYRSFKTEAVIFQTTFESRAADARQMKVMKS